MKDTVYLIFNKRRVDRMIRSGPPTLKAGEYAVRIEVSVDDRNFRRAIPVLSLDIADQHIIEPIPVLEMVEEEPAEAPPSELLPAGDE